MSSQNVVDYVEVDFTNVNSSQLHQYVDFPPKAKFVESFEVSITQ